jgi:ATP-dependent DNA helicase RecQ
MPSPASILKETFGYDSFRPLQKEIIENVLEQKDTLAIMPTGGGKSLCYQIPSLLFDGLTVVVSPLISLMKDQVEQLRAFGVPSLFINSTLSPQEYQQNMDYVKRGEVKLLYVAPETLLTPRILSLLDSVQVDCLTIDEAHCISEWGHDFRPEYRQLVEVRKRFPKAVCLALTATATARVRQDIRNTLKFSTNNEFVASFNRENLYIEVVRKREPVSQVINLINRYKNQSGIIYCFSRKQVDELSAYLESKGFSVKPYHAGLEDIERKKNQELFIRDDVQIIVATIAFGMGINKPNVRFVIHFDLPKSIESYYQEIGRAGRDGLPAHCTLLYSYSDAAKINYFIDQKGGDEKRVAIEHLNAIVRFAEDELICRRKPLLAYFGESYLTDNCSNCDNCTSAPTSLTDITVYAQKFLSCVKRADEKFGANHIVDILLGSKNEKIIRWGHDKLSTYNIGAELTKKQWMHIARQLTSMGYLKEAEYHTLKLTPKAMEMLKKREPVFGVVQEAERVIIKGQRTEVEYNRELFEILRAKRKELADSERVPPYVVFSDKALVEMAAYYPQSESAMMKITGVGKVKFKQYGELFMGMIKSFCEKNNIIALTPNPSPNIGRGESEVGEKTKIIAEGFNNGLTIQELMEGYGITQGTILEHLTKYVMAGNKLRSADELYKATSATKTQLQIAFSAFDESDNLFLRPVFDTLNGALNYDELKILKLLYLIHKQEKT